MIRYRYSLRGRVQGVGFRPFIYREANSFNLKGFIKNTTFGVEIDVEGDEESLIAFETLLSKNLPPLARIDEIEREKLEPLYRKQFEIIQSSSKKAYSFKTACVLPDVAVCSDCIKDIKNREKYKNYFSTNCTNCGPRYSIIQTVPYDRENTSMKDFTLCDSCFEDYHNPLSRRYHAQPTSCKECGPRLELRVEGLGFRDEVDIYESVAGLIKDGKIGAIKGVGGFHIVCDWSNKEVVKRLREFKNRPTKPFAIMFKELEMIKEYVGEVSGEEKELLLSKEAPIVIINRVGCLLPYTPFYHLLFEYLDTPILATSANLGGEPIITKVEELEEKLPFLEFVVGYNREIVNAIDDSLTQIVDKNTQILRLGRGYAPKEITLPFKVSKKILAVGANQKSSIALAFENKIVLSPYIGDLNSIKSFEFFERTLESFKRFYDFEPDVIVHDKHPNYETTKWAKKQEKELFEVQHHLAHIYSVKAESGLEGEYLGFSFDGTGYGDDGSLWGGEIFIGDERRYYFKPIKLLGGEKAIKEPRRVALSMLFEKYSLEEILEMDFEFLKTFSQSELEMLYFSWQKGVNSPLSSSVGRLFDGVASFANLCHFQTFEGEAGLECEKVYDSRVGESFNYKIEYGEIDIDFDFFDRDIVTKFINTLVKIICDIAILEDREVILSGGVFQNSTLLEYLVLKLKELGIKYYYNSTTPINDQGIALGQIWYYMNNYSFKRE